MSNIEVEFVPCKKCGRLPRFRSRKYTTMVYCSGGCMRLFRKNFDDALRSWNKANRIEVENG